MDEGRKTYPVWSINYMGHSISMFTDLGEYYVVDDKRDMQFYNYESAKKHVRALEGKKK